MIRYFFLVSFVFIFQYNLFSQHKQLDFFNRNGHSVSTRSDLPVRKGFVTTIDKDILKQINRENIPSFSTSFEYNKFNDHINLDLVEFNLLTDDFSLVNSKNEEVKYQKGKYYTALTDDKTGFGAFSFYDNKLIGLVSYQSGETYNIGTTGNASSEYIIYKDKDFMDDLHLYCDTKDDYFELSEESAETNNSSLSSGKCINIYIEADYALYIQNGKSIKETTDYILGLFAESALLYKKEGINIKVSKIKIWEIPDSYSKAASGEALSQFSSNNYESETDLNLLLALGANGLGGIAYLNALCKKYRHFAYANISATYKNIPVYSWSAMVITHELGHNLGSKHTHSCSWNGNYTQIDDCGNIYYYNSGDTPEGDFCFDPDDPIIPLDGGTIMSYCHLIGSVGINLHKGFGLQPGDYIRNKVANASCLDSCEGFGEQKPIADFEPEEFFTCEGGEITFFDKSINNPTDWTWIFDNGTGNDTMHHKFPVMKYNATGEFDVEMIASNRQGNDTLKRNKYITVIDGPKASFTYDYLDKTKVQFNNQSVNADSYFWRFGDGRINLTANPKHKFKDGGKYLVELWAKKDTCKVKNYFADTVEIKIPIKAQIQYNKNKICKGDTILFKAGSASYDSVKWYFEGGTVNTNDLEEMEVVYYNQGNFDVSMIAYSKYGIDTLFKNDLVKVTGKPQGDFVFEIHTDTVFFTNTFDGNLYFWDFGDNSISTEKNPVHIYANKGNYEVRLITKNLCDSSVLMKNVIINPTQIESTTSNNIFVYPNPVKNFLYLMDSPESKDINMVYFVDVLGNIIYEKHYNKILKTGIGYKIDVSLLKKGIYFLKIENEGKILIKKIIKN